MPKTWRVGVVVVRKATLSGEEEIGKTQHHHDPEEGQEDNRIVPGGRDGVVVGHHPTHNLNIWAGAWKG